MVTWKRGRSGIPSLEAKRLIKMKFARHLMNPTSPIDGYEGNESDNMAGRSNGRVENLSMLNIIPNMPRDLHHSQILRRNDEFQVGGSTDQQVLNGPARTDALRRSDRAHQKEAVQESRLAGKCIAEQRDLEGPSRGG